MWPHVAMQPQDKIISFEVLLSWLGCLHDLKILFDVLGNGELVKRIRDACSLGEQRSSALCTVSAAGGVSVLVGIGEGACE